LRKFGKFLGVNIEDISEKRPDAIKILPIDVKKGLSEEAALNYVKSLKFQGDLIEQAKEIVLKVYKAFVENDALMIEINPLATVNDNGTLRVLVLDSKVSVDENAKYRQKEIGDSIDESNKVPSEREAEAYNLNFIRLDGNIGCLVNGAGIYLAFYFLNANKII
jgi:succinyl-CoA synthetase beta subunit